MKQSISIERLVQWAFIEEKVRYGGTDDVARSPYVDSLVRLERIHELGAIIQGSAPGGRYVASESADDAVLVADAVLHIPERQRGLVISHGRASTRPDWKPFANHRWEPERWQEHGSLAVSRRCHIRDVPHGHRTGYWREGGRKREVRVYSTYVPVVEIDSPRSIAAHRRDYAAWWDGLHAAGVIVAGRLDRWTLTSEMPPHQPWARRADRVA